MSMLEGVHVAAVTPFTGTGEIDIDAYLAHVRWLAGHGVDGIVAFGTNGEGTSCALDEKLAAVRALAEAKLGVALLPTAMEGNLPDTQRFLEACNELPVQAVMVLPPYYFRPADEAGVHAFFERAVRTSRHPVVLYHIPKYAVPVPEYSIRELPIWGIKNSAGDTALTRRTLGAGRGVLLGTEDDLWGQLNTGAEGMISALANFAPERLAALYRHHRAGEEAAGRPIAEALEAARRQTKQFVAPALLKRLAEARHGHPMGGVRPPLTEPAEDMDPTPILETAGVSR